MDRAIQIKKLRYQSWYRGCKETDRILGHYCKSHIESLNDAELDDLEILLNEADVDLFAWLTGKKPIPDDLSQNKLLPKLKAFEYHTVLH